MGLFSRIKGAGQILAQSLSVLLGAPSLFLYTFLAACSGILVRMTILLAILVTPGVREPLFEDIRILSRAAYEGIKTDIQRENAEKRERETGVKQTVPVGPRAEDVFASLKPPSLGGSIGVVALGLLAVPVAMLGRGLFKMAFLCAAGNVLRGSPRGFGSNLAQAAGRLPALVGWGLMVMGATMLRDAVTSRLWFGESTVRSLTDAAGRAVSVFVMPAMAVDGLGPFDALKRSFEGVKKVWGEGAVIAVTLSPLRAPMLLLDGGLLFLGVCVLPASLFGGLVLVFLGTCSLLAYRCVVRAVDAMTYLALYQYASAGQVAPGFSSDGLQAALVNK